MDQKRTTRRNADGTRRGTVNKICQQCGADFLCWPSDDFLKFCSNACKGKSRVGKPGHPITNRTHNARQSFGKGGARADLMQYFRSRWEANYARYLRHTGSTYRYEPHTFVIHLGDGTSHNYTPDFLVDNDHYVEIKGWMREDRRSGEIVMAAFSQLPKPLTLFDAPKYRQLESEFCRVIVGWEGRKSPVERPVKECEICGAMLGKFGSRYCSRACAGKGKSGKPRSLEVRMKLRLANLGKTLSPEHTASIKRGKAEAKLRRSAVSPAVIK